MLVQNIDQIVSHHVVIVGNRAGQDLIRVGRHLPAQIEGDASIAIGHLQSGPHPFPEFVRTSLAKVEIRQRPAGFELAIDRERFLKPAFRGVVISTKLGSQTEPNARRGRSRVECGNVLQ
jgi:hypothetical protein